MMKVRLVDGLRRGSAGCGGSWHAEKGERVGAGAVRQTGSAGR